jgi:apolipoprotein D and lipocalin family protein
MNLRKILFLFAAMAVSCGLTSCSIMAKKSDLKTVPYVDLPRYMGEWRVIANIPYFAEKDCVDSIEGYSLRADGKIDNTFEFRKKSFDAPQKKLKFIAEVVNKETNAEWRIKFLPFLKVAYLVIDLDPKYQWVVVGHPSKRYGWIMARQKTLPDSVYNGILERLGKQGYDPKKFVKVPQSPN